nr:F-box protein [Alphaproteobacteria bacterium]
MLKRLYKFLIVGFLLYSPLYASDSEFELLLPEGDMEVVRVPSPEDLPENIPSLPKDVWHAHILPHLFMTDHFALRSVSRSFKQMIDTDRRTQNEMSIRLRHQMAYNVDIPFFINKNMPNLQEYVREWGIYLKALEHFPSDNDQPEGYLDHKREVFTMLWALRKIPHMDMAVILKGCEIYDVSTKFNVLKDIASWRIGNHYRHPTLNKWGSFLIPTAAFASGVYMLGWWSLPVARLSEMPWVELFIPMLKWSPTMDDSVPRYGIDTIPNVNTPTGNIAAQVIDQCNNYTLNRLSLTSMSPYLSGPIMDSFPFRLILPVLSVGMFAAHLKSTWSLSTPNIDAVSLMDAFEYYKRIYIGRTTYKSFETYLYRVSKMLITAGVIAYLTGNIIEYYDYTHSYLANFGWNYNQSVELLQRTYMDKYISYISILPKYLYENAFNPLEDGDPCPVYFLPQVFKNYTDFFVRYGLMRPNDWQY